MSTLKILGLLNKQVKGESEMYYIDFNDVISANEKGAPLDFVVDFVEDWYYNHKHTPLTARWDGISEENTYCHCVSPDEVESWVEEMSEGSSSKEIFVNIAGKFIKEVFKYV